MKTLTHLFKRKSASRLSKVESQIEQHNSHMVSLIRELKRNNRVLDIMSNNIEKIFSSNNEAIGIYGRTLESIRFALCDRDGTPNVQLWNISLRLDKIIKDFSKNEP